MWIICLENMDFSKEQTRKKIFSGAMFFFSDKNGVIQKHSYKEYQYFERVERI